ncbi:MAG: transcriptional repressor LexA [Gemmatimonadetes bacterium]|nr:transcriptional repressor LexA [Gemmatimonadota bacterium]
MPLTKRQREILDYLRDFIADFGYAPSFDEIRQDFGYASLATVHEHLTNLQRKGYIRRSFRRSRSVEIEPQVEPAAALPLLGTVAAGAPIEAIEDAGEMSIPGEMVGSGGEHFVLRVEGDSMIDEQIRDGDHIVVRSGQTAADGEMVVALVGGEAATVKKLYRESGDRVRLQPANPEVAPIVEAAADVQVQGVVVGLVRKY